MQQVYLTYCEMCFLEKLYNGNHSKFIAEILNSVGES